MLARLRAVFFWCHLAIGVLVGVVLLVMGSSGTMLAFENEIIAAVESGSVARPPGAGAARLPPSVLLERSKARLPQGLAVSALTVRAEPDAPALLATKGRFWLVDPYRGELLEESRVRAFFGFVEDVHRNLALARVGKASLGKFFTGWTAAGVVFLALSGPILWWPRTRREGRFRRIAFFIRSSSAAARDFNRHNVVGIWTVAVLVSIAATGTTIAFDGVRRFVSETLGVAPPRPVEPAPPEATFDLDAAWTDATRRVPDWAAVNVRWPAKDGKLPFRVRTGRGTRPYEWTFLSYDVETGALTELSRYEDFRAGTKTLRWARWLHTGQALGLVGQIAGALTAVGAVVLAWTGLTLALRRLRRALDRTRGARAPRA